MRSLSTAVIAALALGLLATVSVSGRVQPLTVWFAPSPGSLDYLRLFDSPDEWPMTRARMSVFKFYQQHTTMPAAPNVGPNSYDALRAVDAFRMVTAVWHKRLALEVGAVKPQYCSGGTIDPTAALRETFAAIGNVERAGGTVDYLAMDEPFLSGKSAACGGPDPGPTLQALERYVGTLQVFAPSIGVGLIEPYPYFSAVHLQEFITAMALRGIKPAFFHLDIDLNAIKPATDTLAQDVVALAARCAQEGIQFGIIVWGNNGDSDALYAEDAMRLARRIGEAFPEQLPPQIIFQSWAVSRTGQSMTPTNLPENAANTHTFLIRAALRLLARPDADNRDDARPSPSMRKYGKVLRPQD